jgi:hypothetical protein
MKNVSVKMALAAMLLAGTTRANDITIKWNVTPTSYLSSYLPKVASDGLQNVVTIAETGTGLSAVIDELGLYQPLTSEQVQWTGSPSYLYGPTQQVGHAPTIALAYDSVDNYDGAIEVHQGGQDSESSLWFQLGSIAPPPSALAISWGSATRLGPGPWACGPYPRGCGAGPYDYGYNPTVAADLDGPSFTSSTVVEAHQAASGESTLYYHVGVLTLGPSPSISWGPSLAVSTTQGSAPTVSISNNVAVLVAQGSGGTLWSSIGVVDTATSTIAWTTPSQYASGYNPTVSVYGSGTDLLISGRALVEAHQLDNGTGPLVASVGVLKGSSPTSITWSDTTNVPYGSGCYPSVALAGGVGPYPPYNLTVTEIHEAGCGSATMTDYSFGYLVGK